MLAGDAMEHLYGHLPVYGELRGQDDLVLVGGLQARLGPGKKDHASRTQLGQRVDLSGRYRGGIDDDPAGDAAFLAEDLLDGRLDAAGAEGGPLGTFDRHPWLVEEVCNAHLDGLQDRRLGAADHSHQATVFADLLQKCCGCEFADVAQVGPHKAGASHLAHGRAVAVVGHHGNALADQFGDGGSDFRRRDAVDGHAVSALGLLQRGDLTGRCSAFNLLDRRHLHFAGNRFSGRRNFLRRMIGNQHEVLGVRFLLFLRGLLAADERHEQNQHTDPGEKSHRSPPIV